MIVVIGCGNPNRSDDGAGPEVVRLLRGRIGDLGEGEVRLFDAGTDGMSVMFAARGCKTLIVVDAARSNSPPGAIFELPGAEAERNYEPALNLHDFRWNHALFAGRKIFQSEFPSDVLVMLIEAQSVELGVGLTPPVAEAAAKAAARIESVIRERLRQPRPETAS